MQAVFGNLVEFIRDTYQSVDFIPLHEPRFFGNEKTYLIDCVDSTFVSSVGKYVDKLEVDIAEFTGSNFAIASVNGTSALHVSLLLAGVQTDDLVITQSLTFVATCNAISYCGADPVFVDVDLSTMGLSPAAMEQWLEEFAFVDDKGVARHRESMRRIQACVPMHTFGHPVDLDGLVKLCESWNIALVEDAAESLGSYYRGRHTGTFGLVSAVSFNGNKIITTGGGGMVLTNDPDKAKLAKHVTTTAKQPHQYEYVHDQVAYNYRMPNINAALGCAQLESINSILDRKRELAMKYEDYFSSSSLNFFNEPEACQSNYWLNAVICSDRAERDDLLHHTNENGVMTRPIWCLMNKLPMYKRMLSGELPNAEWLEDRVVNLPSSVGVGV